MRFDINAAEHEIRLESHLSWLWQPGFKLPRILVILWIFEKFELHIDQQGDGIQSVWMATVGLQDIAL